MCIRDRLLGLSTPETQKNVFNVELPEEIKTAMSEIEVIPAMLVKGDRLMDLVLPDNTLVALIKKNDSYCVPKGKTKLHTGDKLLVITDDDEEMCIRDRICPMISKGRAPIARLTPISPVRSRTVIIMILLTPITPANRVPKPTIQINRSIPINRFSYNLYNFSAFTSRTDVYKRQLST